MTQASNVFFNCCTDGVAPDWSQYSWLEVGGCTTETDEQGNTWTNGLEPDDVAEFWTVYGRLKEGGCEAITDVPTRDGVDLIAAELGRMSGLAVK